MAPSNYRPEIDGLRAVAILPVVFFHAGVPGFSGGYVGVDIFFVISGFLITQLLLQVQHWDFGSLLEFWERRIRRIFPALIAMLLVVSALGLLFYFPNELYRLGYELFWQSLFSSNLYFYYETGGYFGGAEESRTLLHTWSLSVEEQFYLLYPLLFLALARKSRLFMVGVLSGLIGLSLCISVWLANVDQPANFFLLPSRIWELGSGGLLAISMRNWEWKGPVELPALVGVGMIIAAVLLYDANSPIPGVHALLPVLGAVILIVVGGQSRTIGGVLKTRVAVALGKISYPLYLWHWPLLVILEQASIERPELTERLLVVALSFVLAGLSWKYIEQPFRSKRLYAEARRIFVPAALSLVFLVSISTIIIASEGFIGRWSPEAIEYLYNTQSRVAKIQGRCEIIAGEGELIGRRCLVGGVKKENVPNVLIWGDSHASVILKAFSDSRGGGEYNLWLASMASCSPVMDLTFESNRYCTQFKKTILDWIDRGDIDHIVLVAKWSGYRDIDGFSTALSETVSGLQSKEAKVWIMRQPPEHRVFAPGKVARAADRKLDLVTNGLPFARIVEHRKMELSSFGSAHDIVFGILDPTILLCRSGFCPVAVDGAPVYFDFHHLSIAGVDLLKPYFETCFWPKIKREPVDSPHIATEAGVFSGACSD